MHRTARLAAVATLFLLVVLLTRSAYLGDTNRYINDILSHRAHAFAPNHDPFWDFGHAAWRPLVNFAFDAAGATVQSIRGGNSFQAIAWLMFAITLASTLAATLLMWSFLERHTNAWAAWIGAAAFLCTNAVLDFGRSGSSYVPALACLVLSLWLIQSAHIRQKAGSEASVLMIAAGLSLGAALLLWLPFLFGVPATILYAVYGSPTIGPRLRMKSALVLLVSSGILMGVVYAAILQQRQVRSIAEVKSWMSSSQNNEAQTDKLKRAVSGIPRSFLDLGDDTVAMKRYVFHDPYAPVRISQIVFAPGTIKLVLFYLYCGVLVLILWKPPEGRRILLFLGTAAASVLVFAVILFEPGGPEKYMPAYPFFFLAAAFALQETGKAHRTVQALMATFLIVVLCAGNFYSKASWRRAADYRAYMNRKGPLDDQAHPGSMVAVADFWDPLYRLPALLLLDTEAQSRNLWVYDVIEVANTRVFRWRQEFADNALQRWSQGQQVWISNRLLAEKPQPQWRWVEGDTGRVQWTELREFFSTLDVESRVGGDDGFLLLANNPHNADRLRAVAASPPQ